MCYKDTNLDMINRHSSIYLAEADPSMLSN